MRLWHKYLIPYLPKAQLLGQWRECCCIARELNINGKTNHILINKLMDFPEAQFNAYALAVKYEMERRGYRCDWDRFIKWRVNRNYEWDIDEIFLSWHNDRYLTQCYYNLEEKYDCGGISEEEWNIFVNGFHLVYVKIKD